MIKNNCLLAMIWYYYGMIQVNNIFASSHSFEIMWKFCFVLIWQVTLTSISKTTSLDTSYLNKHNEKIIFWKIVSMWIRINYWGQQSCFCSLKCQLSKHFNLFVCNRLFKFWFKLHLDCLKWSLTKLNVFANWNNITDCSVVS